VAGRKEQQADSRGQREAARREEVREDIARRIKNACAHFDPDEFRQLTEQMADRQLRNEARASQSFWRDAKPH
jgi:hypothetical protein